MKKKPLILAVLALGLTHGLLAPTPSRCGSWTPRRPP